MKSKQSKELKKTAAPTGRGAAAEGTHAQHSLEPMTSLVQQWSPRQLQRTRLLLRGADWVKVNGAVHLSLSFMIKKKKEKKT